MESVCMLCTRVAHLVEVQLVPIKKLKDKKQSETGSITICSDCHSRLPIDFTGLSQSIDEAVTDLMASDDMFRFFITEWILKVWHMGHPPSYQDIADALNKVRLYNTVGTPWSYHNIMAKIKRLAVDKDEIAHTRAPIDHRGNIENMIELMKQEALATLAASQREQIVAIAEDWNVDTSNPVPEDWAAGTMAPLDMPGQEL